MVRREVAAVEVPPPPSQRRLALENYRDEGGGFAAPFLPIKSTSSVIASAAKQPPPYAGSSSKCTRHCEGLPEATPKLPCPYPSPSTSSSDSYRSLKSSSRIRGTVAELQNPHPAFAGLSLRSRIFKSSNLQIFKSSNLQISPALSPICPPCRRKKGPATL